MHVLQPPSMTLSQGPSRRSPGLGSPRAPDAPTRRRRGYPLRHARQRSAPPAGIGGGSGSGGRVTSELGGVVCSAAAGRAGWGGAGSCCGRHLGRVVIVGLLGSCRRRPLFLFPPHAAPASGQQRPAAPSSARHAVLAVTAVVGRRLQSVRRGSVCVLDLRVEGC